MPMILFVDDEKIILDTLQRQLASLGKHFQLEFAESAEEALEILEEEQELRLVISDWLMPGMKGDQFLMEVSKLFPDSGRMLLTGHAPNGTIRNIEDKKIAIVINKPWDQKELEQKVVELLAS